MVSSVHFPTLVDVAQIVSAAASTVALIIAAIAAGIAKNQIQQNAKLARENTPLSTHRELLQLCIERPELSSSALMLKALARKDFAGIQEELTPESERALWFLSFVLNAMEQVLESNPRDQAWRSTMAAQVEFHEDLLRVVWPDWASHYGDQLRRFVASELDGQAVKRSRFIESATASGKTAHAG